MSKKKAEWIKLGVRIFVTLALLAVGTYLVIYPQYSPTTSTPKWGPVELTTQSVGLVILVIVAMIIWGKFIVNFLVSLFVSFLRF